MSRPLSPTAVAERTATRLAEFARNGRSYDQAAAILGISHSSCWNKVAGKVAWDLGEMIRGICHAEQFDGDRSILDGLITDIRGGVAAPAVRPEAAAMRVMGGAAAMIQALSQHLGNDGRIDQHEAGETLVAMRHLQVELDRLERICDDLVRGRA